MTSPKISRFAKTLLGFFFIVGLVLSPGLVQAQEQTEEEKEFKTYEEIKAASDPIQKADMAFKFLKEKPKSTYRPNVIDEFRKAIDSLKNDKKWAQIISTGEKLLSVVPGDDYTITAMTAAYASTGNTKGFAAYGEQAYPSAPSAGLALAIAKAYKQLGNDAKYVQWAERTLSKDPNNIDILSDMVRRTLAQNNFAQASKYARQNLKALATAKKPADMDEQTWKNEINVNYAVSYAAIGATAYQNQNYAEAIKNLDSAVKYYKRMDMAYYFLGMSYWQQNKLAQAQLNFAKAYLLKGSISGQSKKYLEQLWSNSHRGSLSGIEVVLQRAQAELK